MIYSIPYLVLITFYGIMALWFKQTKNIKIRAWNISLCFIITLIFWGFRGFCFYDWMSYYPMFLQSGIENLSYNITIIEPGFCILMTLCKELYDNYIFFTFVCSLINITLLTVFLQKHTDNYPYTLLISTIFGCFLLFTDLMRNAIAVFIFINALDYIAKKKPLKYFMTISICISFHYSAILFIPFYFFANKTINKKIYATIFFAGVCIYALNISLLANAADLILGFINKDLEGKVRYYLDAEAATSKVNFVFLEQFFTGCLVLCYMEKLRSIRENANIYINSILLFFIFTFYLHEFVTLSTRLSILFAAGYWIIWNDIPKCLTFKNNKILFATFAFFYCFLRILGHTSNALANYDNVLFDAMRYQQRVSLFNKYFKD